MDFEDGCLNELGDVPENDNPFVDKIPDAERVVGHLLDELHHALDSW